MNHAMKGALGGGGPHAHPASLRAASLFHSTPVLERKRKTHHWNSRFNYYAKRVRKMESKRTLLRNLSEYAEHLFQSWRVDDDRDHFSPMGGPSWFRRQYGSMGTRKRGFSSFEWESYRHKRKGGFDFCSSDDDAETIFRSAFGGERHNYWSFGGSENFHWRCSSGYANYKSSWNRKYETDETDDETDNAPQSDLASERLALGLSASGPLKLEQVKSAYRTCALRWHPDRHQGSSKEMAEEKFKNCSSAYKSLCDRLATS